MHLYILTPLHSHCYTSKIFSPQGPSWRRTDTVNEPGQQNSCQYWKFHFLPHRKHTTFPVQRSVT